MDRYDKAKTNERPWLTTMVCYTTPADGRAHDNHMTNHHKTKGWPQKGVATTLFNASLQVCLLPEN